jgi:hypothetical protein
MSNNGLMTKIWGPPTWFMIDSIVFGYPTNPSDEQKKNYKNFLLQLGNVLPCSLCRDSYKIFITNEDTELTDQVFTNRETLTKWAFNLHNRVNKKLKVNYGTTYEEYCNKFESFRAVCTEPVNDYDICNMPRELKTIAYNNFNIIQSIIVPYEIVSKFKKYATMRDISFDCIDKIYDVINKRKEKYNLRNKACRKIINYMRKNNIPSIEQTGKYKGLPTVHELYLLRLGCSLLPLEQLQNIL